MQKSYQNNNHESTLRTPLHSASDLAAAINAIVIESDFDDATRPGLMAAMDVASGRDLPFQMADRYVGMRMTRHSSVSVEFTGDVSDRAHEERWRRAWKLIDAEQARTGHRFVERRRGGMRGENREKMKRTASTYCVPLVQIVVDVVRRARSYRARFGPKRVELYRQAAREVLASRPQDYRPETPPLPRATSNAAHVRSLSPEAATESPDGTTTRIVKSHLRLVQRAAENVKKAQLSEAEADGLRLKLIQQVEDSFDSLFAAEAAEQSPDISGMYHYGSGEVVHAIEPDFPPSEPSDSDNPECFADANTETSASSTASHNTEPHAHELFQKANENAGEKDVTVHTAVAIAADNKQPKNMLDVALYYATDLQWKVFPLHTPTPFGGCSCRNPKCASIGKHPRTKNGLKAATNDPEQIKELWSGCPDANIGLATGHASGILVVDVDPRHAGWESLEALFHRIGGVFPSTAEVITGSGGRHFLFQMPDADIRNSTGKLGAGLDVRANGGYVVAAPSQHASGNRYRWAAEELSVPEVPYLLMQELIAPPKTRSTSTNGISTNGTTCKTWSGDLIVEGGRNDTLFRHAAAMRGCGADEGGIFAGLLELNRSCSPQLGESELSKIAASVATRYAAGSRIINMGGVA